MKQNKFLKKLLFALSMPIIMLSCDGDEEGPGAISADFGSIASSSVEAGGSSVTIPLRNVSASALSKLSVEFGGTATEGQDFNLVGITSEGVQLSILDDSKFEEDETIRVKLVGSGMELNGNSIHNVTIRRDCADNDADYFQHSFATSEIYAPDDIYTGYSIEWEQDATDPNKFWTDNFWDSGLPAYIVYNPATKTVSFPTQTPQPSFPTRIVTSTPATATATFDNKCKFTIPTSYRGYTWDYEFVREDFPEDH